MELVGLVYFDEAVFMLAENDGEYEGVIAYSAGAARAVLWDWGTLLARVIEVQADCSEIGLPTDCDQDNDSLQGEYLDTVMNLLLVGGEIQERVPDSEDDDAPNCAWVTDIPSDTCPVILLSYVGEGDTVHAVVCFDKCRARAILEACAVCDADALAVALESVDQSGAPARSQFDSIELPDLLALGLYQALYLIMLCIDEDPDDDSDELDQHPSVSDTYDN